MKTSFTTPLNLAGYLIKHPEHWYDYIANCALTDKSPIEAGLPWISLPAIEFLDKFVQKGAKVFEFGGGGSTIFFANKGAIVETLETDVDWFNKIRSLTKNNQFGKVKIYYSRFLATTPAALRKSDYIKTLGRDTYDIILIDGQEIENFQARPICFEWAEKQINPGGIIIIDDSWRYTHLRKKNKASRVEVFEGIGPARKGMTSTDIYFY